MESSNSTETNDPNLIQFGKDLNAARKAKGISLVNLAIRILGQANTSRVIDYEKGRSRPNPQNLANLARALEVTYARENYWMGLCGYIPSTRIPPLGQLTSVLENIAESIQNYRYPAYILDYQYRAWVANHAMTQLVGSRDLTAGIISRTPRLEVIFGQDLQFSQLLSAESLEGYYREQVKLFKSMNAYRRHEEFYKDYASNVASKLNDDERTNFYKIWNQLPEEDAELQPYQVATITFRLPNQPDNLGFIIRPERIMALGEIFVLCRYTPVDNETIPQNIERLENLFPINKTNPDCLKLWELIDVTPLTTT